MPDEATLKLKYVTETINNLIKPNQATEIISGHRKNNSGFMENAPLSSTDKPRSKQKSIHQRPDSNLK